ncbi:MAG TPA: cytochrome c biogenesis protein CcdA [Ferruginibacter sp.]|nr:cytochrome c biogenesis protein CcdA [Ferruginibacter sp.]HNG62141.1 cytochrome c biogenesis protein CcdA [Ferruginibacter sp.]HNL64187.1 cytochrome c biogenesis protein CcdA [Ferruginibacter sp.]
MELVFCECAMYNFLRPILSLFLTATILFATGQTDSAGPVFKWTVTSKKLSEKKYELVFKAPAVAGNNLYAPGQDLDGVQSAGISFPDSSIISGVINGGSNVQTTASAIFSKGTVQLVNGDAEWKTVIEFRDIVPAKLLGELTFFYNKGEEFKSDPPFAFSTALEGGIATGGKIKIASIDIKNPAEPCGDDAAESKSLGGIFLLGFLGGLIALLTPCVFPMIPVTVTFFTKKSQDRKKGVANALFYGLFIFFIYIAITIPFHVASKAISPEIFNNISTNVWLNLLFFIVFIVFALSFFGLFEIGLPASFANKADSRSGLGNLLGIFFMAGTLAIVSFSCTGPILGTLLANVANEGPWPLTVGAAGFGLALGLPFALFAMFPNWLHSLPKSGGWMTELKVVLGFVELALAVKFLANADNVEQWGIVKREFFIAAWILIGLLIVLYLLGWLKIGHGSGKRKFSLVRSGFILFFTAFTLYLIPGLTNTKWANLRLLSGFPPPISYSIYTDHVLLVKGIEPIHNDYEKALAKARAENKPLLVDFTGWACVNCRRMEELVWTNREVDSIMRNEFVVVSLYVDERTKLPATAQTDFTTGTGTVKPIISVGDKWATFQTENFGATSQPQYAILSPDEKALTKTKFYTPDPAEFAEWLRCGIRAMPKK